MNFGEYLVSKSSLSSGTALAHLLALQAGTGAGQTVFASMFSVRVCRNKLTLIQRDAAHERNERFALEQCYTTGIRRDAAFVITKGASISINDRPELLAVRNTREHDVHIKRDVESAVVHQDDLLEMKQ